LPLCFAISAVILFVAEVLSKKKSEKEFDLKSAFLMGIAQGFAVFPGISRSGATISAGLMAGRNKKDVAKFSFVMSIPIVLLSLIMEIYEICSGILVVNVGFWPLLLSFVVAFLVGIFSIKIMIKLTSKANLKWFSAYLILISIFSLFLM